MWYCFSKVPGVGLGDGQSRDHALGLCWLSVMQTRAEVVVVVVFLVVAVMAESQSLGTNLGYLCSRFGVERGHNKRVCKETRVPHRLRGA